MGAARLASAAAAKALREAEQVFPQVIARLQANRSRYVQQVAAIKQNVQAEIDSLKAQLLAVRTAHVEHVRQLKEQFSADYHALEQKHTSVQRELTSAQEQIKALQSTNEGLISKLDTYASVKQFLAQIAGEANEHSRIGPG
jgi:hypothetical protein